MTAVAWHGAYLGLELAQRAPDSQAMLVTDHLTVYTLTELLPTGTGKPTAAFADRIETRSAGEQQDSVDVADAAVIPVTRVSTAGRGKTSVELLIVVVGRSQTTTLLWQYRGPTVRTALATGHCTPTTVLVSTVGSPPPPCLRLVSTPVRAPSAAGLADLSFALLVPDGVMLGIVDTAAPRAGAGAAAAAGASTSLELEQFLRPEAELQLPGTAGLPAGSLLAGTAGVPGARALAPPGAPSGLSGVTTANDVRVAAREAAARACGLALTPLHVFVAFPGSVLAFNRATREQAGWRLDLALPRSAGEAAAASAIGGGRGWDAGPGWRERVGSVAAGGAGGGRGDAEAAASRILGLVQDSAAPRPPGPDESDAHTQGRAVGILAYARAKLISVVIVDEARDEWKSLVERALSESDERRSAWLFEDAARQARDPSQRMWVVARRADWLISRGRAEEAADVLATTSRPFEGVVMRFASEGRSRALIRYATNVLEASTSVGDGLREIQQAVLSTWLLELYLTHLDEVAAEPDDTRESIMLDDDGEPVTEATVLTELRDFVEAFAEWMHGPTVLNLALSHGQESIFELLW